MRGAPIPMAFNWDGEAMIPLSPRLADRQYCVGEQYRLVVEEDRSANSHRHYFASIHEAWINLPPETAAQFASAEQLRKHALIKCGYHDKFSIVASSKAEALRIAAFIRPMDEYAIVVVSGRVVDRYTAKSQATAAMGKATFQASKQAVLDWVAGLIGVSADTLSSNAGQAA